MDLLRTWWPVLLLAGVPALFQLAANAIHALAVGVLDRRIRDDLPLTAGAWLCDQLRELGLERELKVVTSERPTDGYVPWERTIHLADTTYFKRDPLYWAIAAHELGHAHLEVWHPRLTSVLRARWPRMLATGAGLALVLGNLLFARAWMDRLAFVSLATAVALASLRVIEELVASAFAWRRLRRAGALTARHRAAAWVALATAFATYAASYAGQVYLLTRWDVLEHIAGAGRATTGGLTWLGELGLVCCTFGLVFHALVALVELRRGRGLPGFGVFELGVSLGLVWLAWDGGHGAFYMSCVLAACVPAAGLVVGLIALPTALAYAPVHRRAARLGGGVDRTDVFRTDRRNGAAQVESGNRWWRALAMPATFARRASRAWPLLALPLAVAYWLV